MQVSSNKLPMKVSNDNHPIFVYGTLMHDGRAFHLFAAHSLLYATAQLPDALLYASPNGYPIAVDCRTTAQHPIATVLGELHWLRPESNEHLLRRLDQYEGDEYTRLLRPVELIAPPMQIDVEGRQGPPAYFPNASTRSITAWVYLGAASYAARYPPIVSGDWRKQGIHVNY